MAGWPAPSTVSPWLLTEVIRLSEDVWELYHVDADFSEAVDLAAETAGQVGKCKDLFMKEAGRTMCCPSTTADGTLRPDVSQPPAERTRTTLTVYRGMTGMMGREPSST